AIDPDEPPDPSRQPEIEEHRRTCQACRELEQDYRRLGKLARSMPTSMPPEPPGAKDRVMAAAREVFAQHGRDMAPQASSPADAPRPVRTRPRPALLRALAFAAVAVVSLGAGIGLDRSWQVSDPDRLPLAPLGSADVQAARYLDRHGYLDQAKLLARHALDAGGLAPPEKKDAEAILAKRGG
ncbi:MAG TPA: hypothetical protein VFF73_17010, partial [Planctomycetota bacterium]|nr:hypothetical protein [Planctomycetota bacterium]